MTSSDISTCRDLFRNHANSALFVTSQLRPRELKMADGLRRLGWKVGLIYYQWTPFEPHAYFDSCIAVRSASEAHEVAMQLSPRICHVFSGAIDDLVLTFCRQKPSPVVIDLNDVFAPSLFDYCHERFEPTREALALADGFCARDLQVKSAEHTDGFKLPQRLIFFPEYCWNTMAVSEQVEQRAKSDEIHVVSVGTFSLETQGMYDSCYLQLTNMMVEQGIHFHIYPHWAYRRDHSGSPHAKFEQDFAEFIALQEKNPYLHLHDSLSIEDLAAVLPKYDFGIVSGGAAEFGQKLGFYYPAYLDTCYSGRISDYLDAHLPVLINDEVKFDYWLLKRYGICIDLKGLLTHGFKEKLLELKRDPRQRQAMGRAAHTLSVSANAPRLATYYLGVIAAGIPALAGPPAPTFEPQAGTAAPVDVAPAVAEAPPHPVAVPISRAGEVATAIKAKIRWASPRLAKIILPYRAIRIFEFRLHNALQELQANSGVIASLNSRIVSLQHEKDVLATDLVVREHEKRALAGNLAALGLEKESLAADLATLDREKQSLCSKLATLEQEKLSLSSSLATLGQDNLTQRVRISRLENDKTGLSVAAAELRQERVVLLSELAHSERQKAALSAQILSLDTERIKCAERFGGLERDKANLTTSLEGLQQASEDLNANRLDLERDKAALNASVHRLEQDKVSANSHAAALSASAARFERDNIDLSTKVDDLVQQQTGFLARIAGLEQDKSALNSSLQELAREKAALGASLTGLEEIKAGLGATIARLEQDKADFRNQMAGLENDKQALRTQFANFELERAESRRHSTALEQAKASLEGQLASIEQDNVALRNQMAAHEQDKANLGLRIAELEHANKDQQVSNESLQTDLRRFVGLTERERLIPAANHLSAKLWEAVHLDDANYKPLDDQPKLLLACMPKSGSTWLTSVLEERLALAPLRGYLEADRNEQEIDPTVMFQAWGRRVLFVQQHVRYSRILLQICRAFSTKIVVLTRRLDDVVVSLRDHVEGESPEVSMFYTESNWFKEKSQSKQLDFIIDHAMPWYFNFFLGWQRAVEEYRGQILMVSYEDLIRDPVSTVERIASFYGTPLQGLTLSDVDKKDGVRFNQGRVGRGKEVLTVKQQARLRKLAGYYPECNFESVGL